MSLTRPILLGYVSLCLIWGSTWLAIRVVVRDVPPLEAAALRFIAGAVLLLGMAALQKRKWPVEKEQWNAIVTLSLTMMAVPYGLLFWAEQIVTSSMTAVLFSALPLVVALLTPLMIKSKVPRQAVFAMVVAFGGLLVLFYTGLSTSRRSLIAGVVILSAMLFSSWSVVYAKQRLRDVDSVVGTGLQLGLGSIALLWGTWALEAHRHATWTLEAVAALSFLAVFGSCIAFVIYYWLLKRMQPYQVSTINLVVPVVALIEGALLLREAVPLLMLLAVALVLGSVVAALHASRDMGQQDGRVLMLQGRAE